jgi:hypothetical protein
MPGVRCTRGLGKKCPGSATGVPVSTGIPCAMALRFPSCSPRRPGFVVTVTPEKRLLLESLTPATGRQDHTTSPYAPASFVHAREARDDAIASTASCPNARDDGRRPSSGTGR